MKNKYKLENLAKEKEGYYHVNSNITSQNFPQPEIVEINGWKLIEINKHFSSEETLAEIKRQGCRPANIYELALWKQIHEKTIQKLRCYVALGQLWYDDGNHRVPYVYTYSDGDFDFDLGIWGDSWNDGDCLLCFCDKTYGDTLGINPLGVKILSLGDRVRQLEEDMIKIKKILII